MEKANEHKLLSGVTVIVPAYNEMESIADIIQSLKMQSVLPEEIIVLDDCSTDGTGDVARLCGGKTEVTGRYYSIPLSIRRVTSFSSNSLNRPHSGTYI